MARRRRRRSSGRAVRGLRGVSSVALERELSRRRGMVGGLIRVRDRLAQKLAALESKIERLGGAIGGAVGGRGGRRGPGRPRGANSATLAGALANLLKGRTMSVTEMSEAVQKAGYKTNSPNFRTIVNAAVISHRDMFRRVSRGKYTAK